MSARSRRVRWPLLAVALAVVAVGAAGCSDDDADTAQLPPGLTMPTTSTSAPGGSTTSTSLAIDAATTGTDDPNAPLDSFSGVFRSTVVLGPADQSNEPTVVDVCAYLEDASGTTTALLFGDDEERPVTDVSGLIDDGRYGYVVPDGYDPGSDPSTYAGDTNLLRPGAKTEIQGSAGEIDPADAGACPPGSDATKIIVVEKWQVLPG